MFEFRLEFNYYLNIVLRKNNKGVTRGGVAQWVARLIHDRRIPVVVSSSPIKGPRYFLKQVTLFSLLSTGWFQERIRA